jgi:selenocysteine-specific elongation factor
MRRIVIGTAGHVDHGKTSLVRALAGREGGTDRLPEERRRGITIDLGFVEWRAAPDLSVGIVDVPGHRRFVHTMIAGAAGIQGVLLVVAADEGVMPQTREHVAVCELVGVERAVVALTKIDRVDDELARMAEAEVRELLRGKMTAEIVACSARTGAGVDAVLGALRRMIDATPALPPSPRVRLGIDRVFTVRGVGTVVTGTLILGRLTVGMPLVVVGARGPTRTHARGLQVHDAAVDAVEAPARVAIHLAGVGASDVQRGDVVTTGGEISATRALSVELCEGAPLVRGTRGTLHVGTGRVAARVDRVDAIDADGSSPRSARVARLHLDAPLPVAAGDAFVLRGSDVAGPDGAVLGGGRALDVDPAATRRRNESAVAVALARRDAEATVRALVDDRVPRPLARATLARRFVLSEGALEQAAARMTRDRELARVGELGWMKRSALTELVAEARALVADHARRAPLERGMPLAALRGKLAARAGEAAADEAVKLAAVRRSPDDADAIVLEGDVAHGGSRAAALGVALARAVDAATRALDLAGVHGLGEHAAAEATSAPMAEVRAILARLTREGLAIRAGDLWFDARMVETLTARATAHLRAARSMTVIDFKELGGLPRKQAILLLEHLDRAGVTRREGDARVLSGALPAREGEVAR